ATSYCCTPSLHDALPIFGQRKINKGTDKLFGWLGGSREKEMEVGRQLSLQVEQQAKIVEDPMITEYVNRVGQNIVLHSDAKIPRSEEHTSELQSRENLVC